MGKRLQKHLMMCLVHTLYIKGLLFIVSFIQSLLGICKYSDTILEHNDSTHIRTADFQILRFANGVTNPPRFAQNASTEQL